MRTFVPVALRCGADLDVPSSAFSLLCRGFVHDLELRHGTCTVIRGFTLRDRPSWVEFPSVSPLSYPRVWL